MHLGIAIAVLLPILSAALACRPGAAGPNVVFIYVDDQGWTGTSVAMDPGNPDSRSDFFRTPSLERLAREGMTFSQAYSPAAVCSPSRASVLTGKSPASLGVTDVIEAADQSHSHYRRNLDKKLTPPLPRSGLPHEEITYAEYVTRHRPGYATAHFGKWHLDSGGPEKHGFQVGDRDGDGWSPRAETPENPKDTFGITSRTLAFIEEQVSRRRPFVVQVSYQAVHRHIFARAETLERTQARPPGKRHRNARFAAMTEDLDDALGSILDKLDALGIAEVTYVVYTSDNGAAVVEQNNNLPLRSGKLSLHEGGIRVPLVVRGPGIKPGSHSSVPVIGWDLFPTFREWIGIPAPLPDGVEGGSLVPVQQGRGEVERPGSALVWYAPHYYPYYRTITTPRAAIRVGDHKLIRHYDTGRVVLYDLRRDLQERQDLSAARPGLRDALLDQLDRYLESVGAELPRRNPRFDPGAR